MSSSWARSDQEGAADVSVEVALYCTVLYCTDQEGAADVGVEVALYEVHGPRPTHRHHRHVPQRAGHEPRVAAEQREKQSTVITSVQ